jgi:3-oxoacyl-(acyl-carrier-protein) synthase
VKSDTGIVVTGLGVSTTLGHDIETFWTALREGTVGTGDLEHFDTSMLANHRGGELVQLRGQRQPPDPRVPLVVDLAIATATSATHDARLTNSGIDGARIGVVFGTVMGTRPAVERWLVQPQDENPEADLSWMSSTAVSRAPASKLNFAGPNCVISTACASGNSAISYAADALMSGQADAMVAGGSDELSYAMLLMFESFRALSPDVVRPFDLNRRGLMLAEGAAALVLERETDARARKAPIYGRVVGWANVADAHHITAPHPQGDGAARSIRGALRQAGASARDVDYICAHGTGTPTNDASEASAIHSVFGSLTSEMPVSSLKGALGHTQGAASTIEAVCCLLAMRDGVVPPTANCETPDPACDLDVVAREPRPVKMRLVVNNAFGFGGNVECVALGAP